MFSCLLHKKKEIPVAEMYQLYVRSVGIFGVAAEEFCSSDTQKMLLCCVTV